MNKKSKNGFCDEENFSAFFRANSKILQNYIFYKCGNIETANDIVQDAFLKFWSNCDKIIIGKAKSYVFTIATNLFLNEYSKKTTALNFNNNLGANYTNETPEFLLEEKEFHSKLKNALAKLSEPQRTAFLMHRVDGKKYKEIANILGISIKAVEKRIHLALVILRKEIENI